MREKEQSKVTNLVVEKRPLPQGARGAYLDNSGTSPSLLNVKNLTSYSLNVLTTSKKIAFTLAETLITLGVIGIVAAMTIPTLVNNYKTQVGVVKIKKFYSMFNQAIKLSEADNGHIDNWFLECESYAQSHCPLNEVEDWFNNYLGKYIKTLKIEQIAKNNSQNLYLRVYLTDGSVFDINEDMRDIHYLPSENSNTIIYFLLNVKRLQNRFLDYDKCSSSYLDTYCYAWDGTREGLIEGRNYAGAAAKKNSAYCTKLLQYDGWVVKDDNPCKYY